MDLNSTGTRSPASSSHCTHCKQRPSPRQSGEPPAVEARRKGGWIEPASHTGGYFGSSAGWPMGTPGTAPANMTRAIGIRYSWYSRYWQLATFEPHRRLSRGSSASSAYCRHEPDCRAGPQQGTAHLSSGAGNWHTERPRALDAGGGSTACWRLEADCRTTRQRRTAHDRREVSYWHTVLVVIV